MLSKKQKTLQNPISKLLLTKPCLCIWGFCLPFQEPYHAQRIALPSEFLHASQTLFSPIPPTQASSKLPTHCPNFRPRMVKLPCERQVAALFLYSQPVITYAQHNISIKKSSEFGQGKFNDDTAITLHCKSKPSVSGSTVLGVELSTRQLDLWLLCYLVQASNFLSNKAVFASNSLLTLMS